jgi:molybdate transport system substrate-binding protein
MRGGGVYETVKPKLVLGENISQTLQFVQSGAAEAGIVALSLALAPPVAGTGRYWLVPAGMHPRIEQGGAILKSTPRADAARAFRAMMLGDDGRAVLKRYGFTVPGE